MKQVDFYLISNQVNHAHFKFASRLANKLQSMGQAMLLLTDTEADAVQLDAVMWSYSDTSFVAHERLQSDTDPASLAHIEQASNVDDSLLKRNYNVLINLCHKVPAVSPHFARIAEIVCADEAAKQAGRDRYQHYKAAGFELKTHELEL